MDYTKMNLPDKLKEIVCAGDPGARPWLCAMKRNFKRHGPKSVPSPGPLIILFARSHVFVHLFPCEHLISTGILLKSFEHFVGTPDGAKEVKKHGTTIFLQKDCYCYVPPGFLLSLVHYQALQKKPKKKEPMQMAAVVIAPVAFKSVMAGLVDPVKRSILSWCQESTKDKSSDMWANRKNYLEQVLDVGDH